MMKKVLICALAALIALSAIACSGKKSSAVNTMGITVRLLTDASGVDDKSFNAAGWRGILEFYGDNWNNQRLKGIAYDWVTAQTEDMYIPNLKQATDEGYDLIITTGYTWSDALAEVASNNFQQTYLIVDVDWIFDEHGNTYPNVMQAVYAEHEGSYLVGVAAALKAIEDGIVNPRFGFIGGQQSSTITKFEVGYVQGILSVIPNAQIVDYYVDSWTEPALAKTQAKTWYDSGVYAIFSAAGGSGNGTIMQAKEYRAAGRNVWAIGVDSDQHEEGIYNGAGDSAVLTSMLKLVESSVIYALNAVKEDTFVGEIITFDLKADGVGYSSANPAMSKDITDKLEVIKGQIISGEIKVVPTYAEAKRIPGVPQNLRAIDD
jgi:basic membrane protein A